MGEPGPVSERGCWVVVAATFKSEYSWHQCLHDFQDESLVRRGFDPKFTKSVWSAVGESLSFAVSVYTWKLQCCAVLCRQQPPFRPDEIL